MISGKQSCCHADYTSFDAFRQSMTSSDSKSVLVKRILLADFINLRADIVRGVFKIEGCKGDELSDEGEIFLAKSSCRRRRRTEADSACDKRTFRIVRNGVFVAGYAMRFTRTRWLSVPPVTSEKPSATSDFSSAFAFFIIRLW